MAQLAMMVLWSQDMARKWMRVSKRTFHADFYAAWPSTVESWNITEITFDRLMRLCFTSCQVYLSSYWLSRPPGDAAYLGKKVVVLHNAMQED
jgi:hypothetical protein